MKNTILSNIDKENIDIDEIRKHANLLKQGATVIFPTETVYGLGANALDEEAVAKIYEAKGRPSDNPLIVHICDKKDLYNLANNISEKAEMIMDKFWPGPLTIIFQKKDIIPNRTSGGLNTVAVRMPSHPIAISLIKESGIPIAAPSANISGRPSPTDEKHVYEEMNGRVDGIILGGDCNYGLESTVLDLTNNIPMILRPGSITKEDLEEYLGRVDIDPALIKKEDNIVAKAPGMKYTHYSPEADVYIVYGNKEDTINKINYLINENNNNGLKCGVMCMTQHINRYNGEVIGLGDDLEEVGYNLFKSLREMDKKGVDIIYSEAFEDRGVGQAIMNRLLKSAGYKIIQA